MSAAVAPQHPERCLIHYLVDTETVVTAPLKVNHSSDLGVVPMMWSAMAMPEKLGQGEP